MHKTGSFDIVSLADTTSCRKHHYVASPNIKKWLRMDKIKNLHSVSAFYFFVLAMAYMIMVLAFRNGFLAEFFFAIMRILDIPFAFVSLLYGGTTLVIQINSNRREEEGSSPWVLVIFLVCLLLFGGVVFINFGFPSQI